MSEPIRRIMRKYDDNLPKFVYHKNDRKLHAGGLLIYDDTGMWVIKEYFKLDSYKVVDQGGKYTYQDCNIYQTIVREFNEETYLAYPLSYTELTTLIETGKAQEVYACHQDPDKQPTYLCILIHIHDIENLKGEKFNLDPALFHTNRERAIKENPHVPIQYYSSFDFYHLKFVDISKNMMNINFRLKQILHKSFLKKFLFDKNDYLCDSRIESNKGIDHSFTGVTVIPSAVL